MADSRGYVIRTRSHRWQCWSLAGHESVAPQNNAQEIQVWHSVDSHCPNSPYMADILQGQSIHCISNIHTKTSRSEERRVGKSVDLGGRRIIKKKKNANRARPIHTITQKINV